ncbi:HAD-IA family hydrolase [Paraglaciecola arctica]|uniref:HAD-IA family hydrolase n=1 Tax=Paraglaciecola arctica TaxID=1128911 RepID=UPI001C07ECFD|nr:HAD-IA family hydrolase [Paraglaciecola arctica]MBU3005105.1 HAD-IA family hydrolase [Paraglaciecola arctica]
MIFYKKLKPIQAITFDLDDTLYENTSVIVKAQSALIEFMHEQYPATKTLDKTFWRTQQQTHILANPAIKNDIGELRRLTLASGFSALGLVGDELDAATQKSFEHFYFQRSNFTLNRNIHSLLENLANRVPLVAITNGNVDLEQIGISEYFCNSFKASLEFPMKPHIAMFDAAQNYLNISHENILHVGDNLSKDVYGALKAGYQAAWYAEDRSMLIRNEQLQLLPHIQLSRLSQLLDLI